MHTTNTLGSRMAYGHHGGSMDLDSGKAHEERCHYRVHVWAKESSTATSIRRLQGATNNHSAFVGVPLRLCFIRSSMRCGLYNAPPVHWLVCLCVCVVMPPLVAVRIMKAPASYNTAMEKTDFHSLQPPAEHRWAVQQTRSQPTTSGQIDGARVPSVGGSPGGPETLGACYWTLFLLGLNMAFPKHKQPIPTGRIEVLVKLI